MRSALVTILIVLQHVAQLPCRSVTRGALRPRPSASQEDVEAIISRNREITDLLIPLLEANLEAKRHDQKKRKDLLKVFPFRDAAKPIKDPLEDLLPLIKRKSTGKAPLAVILASELRSQKNKKGKSKVHARKAFLIENEDKDYSSEADEDITSGSDHSTSNEDTIEKDDLNNSKEDYDTDIGSDKKQLSFSKNIKNNNTVEVSESKSSETGNDTVSKRKYKKQINLNNKNEDKTTVKGTSSDKSSDIRNKSKRKNKLPSNKSNENDLEDSESNSSEVKHDIDITSKDKHVTKNDQTKEIQLQHGNVTEEKKEIVEEKNNKRNKRILPNIKLVESNDDEDKITKPVVTRVNLNKIEVNYQSNEKVEDQVSEDRENNPERHKTTLPHSDENSVDVVDNSTEPIHELKQNHETSDTDSYKVSKELVVIDISKELARHGEHVKVSKHHHKHYDYNSTSEEDHNSKVYSDSDKSNENNQKYDTEENSVSSEKENHTYDVDISEQPSDSSISYTSEENETSKDLDEEVENQYNDITIENSISEPDQYISDYLDVSDYHESIENKPSEEVHDDYEEDNAIEESAQSASYEDVLDGENYNRHDYESNSEDEYSENDTSYVETEDDIETGMTVESFEDDTAIVDDDNFTGEWIDDGSIESRRAPSKESVEIKNKATFSQELAVKYANDSKYTVEDDTSFVESSGELGKFNVESVEGLIEVLQQDLEIKENECKDKENNENTPDTKHSDSHQDVRKSYKLSFKFNK